MSNEKLQSMFIEDAPQDVNNLGGVESLSDLVIKLQKLEDEIKEDEERLKLKKNLLFTCCRKYLAQVLEDLNLILWAL